MSTRPKPAKPVHLPADNTPALTRPVVPDTAVEHLVARVGRGPILAVLFLAVSLPTLLCVSMIGDLLSSNSGTTQLVGSVDPNVALADGGRTVRVNAVYAGTSQPLHFGTFRVDTWSGRYPERWEGELVTGTAVFIVGKEWIGQVVIRFAGSCPDTKETFDMSATTELIGKPYGWKDRTLYFEPPC